jgi:hypothetical protein
MPGFCFKTGKNQRAILKNHNICVNQCTIPLAVKISIAEHSRSIPFGRLETGNFKKLRWKCNADILVGNSL